MTSIVGVVDAERNIYMGGDTAGTSKNWDQDVFNNRKVFSPVLAPDFLAGVAGSFRLMQVLRYHFQQPDQLPTATEDFEGYASTVLAAALFNCFKKANLFEEQIGEGVDGTLMLGYQGHLVIIQSNLQVLIPSKGYAAIGSADGIARGALHATKDRSAGDRVLLALQASAAHSAGVREPFDIMRLAFDVGWKSSKKKAKRKRGKSK